MAPELPEDVAWLGVLFPGPTETVGSGLHPVVAGRAEITVEVPDQAEALILVGFSALELARHQPPPTPELAERPLLPESSGYALMTASFSGVGALAEGADFTPDSRPRRVSAEWRPPCPDLALTGERIVHLPCAGVPCAPRAIQDGCTLVIDAPACESRWVGSVERGGRISFAEPTLFAECETLEEGERSELECRGPQSTLATCPVTLHPPAWEAPLVDRRELPLVTELDLSSPNARALRHLRGLARHEDRVLTLLGGPAAFEERACPETARWATVDVASMTVVGTSTAPDCPWAFGYDPTGPALILVHGQAPARISRFDLEGRPLRSAALPDSLQPPDWSANNAFVEPVSRAVVVPVGTRARDPGEVQDRDWWLLVFDADTLALRGEPIRVLRLTETMLPSAPGRVAVLHGDSTLNFLDTYASTLRQGLATGALCGPAGRFPAGLYDEPRRRFLLSARGGQNHGITELEADGSGCRTSFPLESPRSAFGLAPWPADPSLALVGLDGLPRAPEVSDSALAFYDLDARRFLIGEQPAGFGPVTNVVPDHDGGLVLLLPAEGKLVRVTPRAP